MKHKLPTKQSREEKSPISEQGFSPCIVTDITLTETSPDQCGFISFPSTPSVVFDTSDLTITPYDGVTSEQNL